MKVTVLSSSGKTILELKELEEGMTVRELKNVFHRHKSSLYPSRQMFRLEPKSPGLKDDDTLAQHNIRDGSSLYFKDLGPQIGWSTVFLSEYTGPLAAYMLFYFRPSWIYGSAVAQASYHNVVHVAALCWTFHYLKRDLETLFVHRFSKGTMPILNLFKNCSYYWGFAAFISYFVNHPLYTPPMFGDLQFYIGLGGFLFCEYGNFVCHCLFRDLRPAGSKVRRIPVPNSNPLSLMFHFVSCPNYTYEIGAWFFFSIMTQSLPGLLFTAGGAAQMAIWALGKHRNYRHEFKDYPRGRKAIFPFFL
ncbi:probable very-long-chain enoyl-CoA reductase art-1 [Sycon ciliatum]|uniref:probable very-long-chain enoyl-CoA reductase art-1 n=1 Tax=Sycon ciliatum TaxID=27933 RepID=UPI0031F61D5A|eukprot:scpid85276/ scgid24406/ Trans-2,3-enoyl-CoA reductase; Synaptic glycoprotein SC2